MANLDTLFVASKMINDAKRDAVKLNNLLIEIGTVTVANGLVTKLVDKRVDDVQAVLGGVRPEDLPKFNNGLGGEIDDILDGLEPNTDHDEAYTHRTPRVYAAQNGRHVQV